MSIAQSILPEFKHEMASTRRLLERVPEEHASWKPHPKSYSLGDLALHIATIPMWARVTVTQDELNFTKANQGTRPVFDTRRALLEMFDANAAGAISALAETSDDEMKKPWALKNEGTVVFSMPRTAVMRGFVMNHLIHHRGQLTVYLRLKDVPLPPIYGGTADER